MIVVVGAALIDGDRCLVALRGPKMSTPGKWEFPGGKVADGETPQAALAREIHEELGLEIRVDRSLGVGTTDRVQLEVFLAEITGGTLDVREHAEVRWIDKHDIDGLDWAEADIPILGALRALLS